MSSSAQPRSDLGILVLLAYQGFVRQLHADMAGRGHDDLGRSDGLVFRMLHAGPRTVSDMAARLEITKQGMAQIVEDGLLAGALGFSTSRTMLHRAVDGEVVPGTYANRDELLGIGEGLARAGHGVFEMASDLNPCAEEFAWMKDVSIQTGMPVSFALLQSPLDDEGWRDQLARTEAANAEGARVTAQIALRGTGVVMNWRTTVHPFLTRASWKAIADKPWAEQLADGDWGAGRLGNRRVMRNHFAGVSPTGYYPGGAPEGQMGYALKKYDIPLKKL